MAYIVGTLSGGGHTLLREAAANRQQEREAIVHAQDSASLSGYPAQNNEPMPNDRPAFWVLFHQSRAASTDVPIKERRISKAWLEEHGRPGMDEEQAEK